jgi:SAM-dependent methyltransferase
VYDLLYAAAGKDYERESAELHALIQTRRPGAASLLDVACGTGAHLEHLADHYEVAGVDLEPRMLDVARRRLPSATLSAGDMRTFDLGRTFDVVTCLFSAIGYMQSTPELHEAIANMTRHLAPGGVLVVDGWIRPEAWRDPGIAHALCAGDARLAVARVGRSYRAGMHTTLEMHHLVGTVDGVEHIVETHELTLFGDDDYRAGFEHAGLDVDVCTSPHPERDRYVGSLPA